MDHIAELGYLATATRFRRLSEQLHSDGDQIYRDHGQDFKASWFSIYYILATSEGPKTVVELAQAIGYTHITVKNVVRELEAKGLVGIVPHPTDGRSKHIRLSDSGKSLLPRLRPIWESFTTTLHQLLDEGHPDFLNHLGRIEQALARQPIHARLHSPESLPQVQIVDYQPTLKQAFYDLAAPWLSEVLQGKLEPEDEFTLRNPDQAYLLPGGFVFYALHQGQVVGCVALKRLSPTTFEFAKLFVAPAARKLGIASRLIARCITRCKENAAEALWLQTTLRMPDAHRLYYKLGFVDAPAPECMDVLGRTEKVMVLGV